LQLLMVDIITVGRENAGALNEESGAGAGAAAPNTETQVASKLTEARPAKTRISHLR